MTSLSIEHSCGFFSCCSVKLYEIIEYFNKHKTLPDTVDSSRQFRMYKTNTSRDVTFDYFKHYTELDAIVYKNHVQYHHDDQFHDYRTIDFKNIIPFVYKYFTPSEEVSVMEQFLTTKYAIDTSSTCVLFHRGNDKNGETKICDYSEYIERAAVIIKKEPTIRFMLQSDETEFIETMLSAFPDNSFYCKDEIRHMPKCHSSVDYRMRTDIEKFSKFYLAITVLMSKCKYVVCGSGNCSIWIAFYRGNSNNMFQNLDGVWLSDYTETL